jgi:mannose-6-phosphate isomerase
MPKLDEPLFFAPIPVERVWGGNRLTALFGKPLPPGKTIGESWELSDRKEVQSIIVGGAFDGQPLSELMARVPSELLGEALAARKPAHFPLLVKYIDAGQDLSVQVHPDDDGCRRLGIKDRGKTECWVVVHAEPGSRMNRGVAPGVTRGGFEKALADGRVEEALHFFTVKPGDVVAIPPGMVHAIGKGIVLAEIQQNSDVTFRVYDYKRVGLDGKPRALHVKESLATIAFDTHPAGFFRGDMKADLMGNAFEAALDGGEKEFLRGRYFDLRVAQMKTGSEWHPASHGSAATVVMCLSGAGALNGRALAAGQTLLLPAALPSAQATFRSAADNELTLLLSSPTADA